MRQRSDLYYAERSFADFVVHPDGRVGEVETIQRGRAHTVKGRREDRPRRMLTVIDVLAEKAVYANMGELSVAKKQQAREAKAKYAMHDSSWSLGDMPDDVIARYNQWAEQSANDDWRLVHQAAADVCAGQLAAGFDAEELVACPYCKHSDPKYACRVCGRVRNMHKYPLVRYYDANEQGQKTPYDVPFNVAEFLNTQDSGRLGFETEYLFDDGGRMTAVEYAVLRTDGELTGVVVGDEEIAQAYIDRADELAEAIRVPVRVWQESDEAPVAPKVFDMGGDYKTLIHELQRKIAIEIVRELADNGYGDKQYTKLVDGVRNLGKGALDVVFASSYEGMGETSFHAYIKNLPFEFRPYFSGDHGDCLRDVVEKASRRIDEKSGKIDLREEGGF